VPQCCQAVSIARHLKDHGVVASRCDFANTPVRFAIRSTTQFAVAVVHGGTTTRAPLRFAAGERAHAIVDTAASTSTGALCASPGCSASVSLACWEHRHLAATAGQFVSHAAARIAASSNSASAGVVGLSVIGEVSVAIIELVDVNVALSEVVAAAVIAAAFFCVAEEVSFVTPVAAAAVDAGPA